jgi:hypothetical protein
MLFPFDNQVIFAALNKAQLAAAGEFDGAELRNRRFGANNVAGTFLNDRGI